MLECWNPGKFQLKIRIFESWKIPIFQFFPDEILELWNISILENSNIPIFPKAILENWNTGILEKSNTFVFTANTPPH